MDLRRCFPQGGLPQVHRLPAMCVTRAESRDRPRREGRSSRSPPRVRAPRRLQIELQLLGWLSNPFRPFFAFRFAASPFYHFGIMLVIFCVLSCFLFCNFSHRVVSKLVFSISRATLSCSSVACCRTSCWGWGQGEIYLSGVRCP